MEGIGEGDCLDSAKMKGNERYRMNAWYSIESASGNEEISCIHVLSKLTKRQTIPPMNSKTLN